MLRIDTAEHFFGLRLNVFTSIVVGLLALAYLVAMRGRPREVITRGAANTTGDGDGVPSAAGADSPDPAAEPGEPAQTSGAHAGDQPRHGERRPSGDT